MTIPISSQPKVESGAQLAEPKARSDNQTRKLPPGGGSFPDAVEATFAQTFERPNTFSACLRSSAIAAVLFFCAINLALGICFRPNLYDLPEHSYIFWAVQGFRALKRTPDIVIFGSSLMVAVTNQGDATYLKHPVDAALHHRSVCLEETIQKKTGAPLSTYSFAIGGQMASDVWAIDRALLDPQRPPKLIIWGIAPRDFVDAAFDGPYSSDTARYMNRIAQTSIIPEDHHSLPGFIEKGLSCISPLFRWRSDLVSMQNNLWHKWLSNMSAPAANQIASGVTPNASHQSSLEVGDCIVPACTELPKTIKDNSAEYQKRYNPFKPKTLKSQLAYLDKFLALNEKVGVKVILINMPLTKQNMAIMPEGAYSQYLDGVSKLAQLHGSQLINCNDAVSFSTKDFSDFVHLTGLGGEKFVALLSTRLTL